MTPTVARLAALTALVVLAGSGCTATDTGARSVRGLAGPGSPDEPVPAGSLRLVAFDGCADLLAKLRAAATEAVTGYGFGQSPPDDLAKSGATGDTAGAAPGAERAAAAADSAVGGATYSGTNTHEAGVDEPDLVKTDGRRIVTVIDGVLRVVDVATRRLSGTLDLGPELRPPDGGGNRPDTTDGPNVRISSQVATPPNLLLIGDRALVLIPGWAGAARLVLVELAGTPRLGSVYRIDGQLVDARQVGGSVRAVVRSTPRLQFPRPDGSGSEADRRRDNQRVVAQAPVEHWLPRYQISTRDGAERRGQVECDAVSHPERYSGVAMLTVLTFDVTGPELGTGNPITVVADGRTVYSNGPNLYLGDDQQPADERTALYKFETAGGKARFVASGAVPGRLINQYALSEWGGHLRVATTRWTRSGGADTSESTVYTLRQDGRGLVERGRVGGLGKGERIYAVRFAGPIGYVVTFRQVDPLYTVDLRDPTRPTVAGELKITGYSSYLHPAGDGRLLGIGQEATAAGRALGGQVSLFSVANLAAPTRLAQHDLGQAGSEAEYDPHAFLYWPASGLLVIPVSGGTRALAMRVGDAAITELGAVAHPTNPGSREHGWLPQIRRSLVIDSSLWTLSSVGLKVSDATSLVEQGWLPFE